MSTFHPLPKWATEEQGEEIKTKIDNIDVDVTPAVEAANAAKTAAESAAQAAGGVAGDAQAAKVAAERAESASLNVERGVFECVELSNSIEAKLDTLHKIMAANRLAKVTVRLNAPGTSYELPSGEYERGELLEGAKIVFQEQGVAHNYEAEISSLVNFSHTFEVYVTDASEYLYSTISAVLGKSATVGYAIAAREIRLKNGDNIVVDLTTHPLEGTLIELCRVQPWIENPVPVSGDKPLATRYKAGVSYLGCRITNANGSTLHLGHYDDDEITWVDQSLTKVTVWDCPSGTTKESWKECEIKPDKDKPAGGSVDSIDIMERLAVFRNMKLVNFILEANNNVKLDSNPAVRFQKCYTKHEFKEMNLPIENADTTLRDNFVMCNVDWFCDIKADADYHPFSLFERYEQQEDGSYAVKELDHAYIMRYPIGATQSVQITHPDGTVATISAPRSKANEGGDYVPGSRNATLNVAKNVNLMRVTVKAEGEEDIVILPHTDARNFSIAGQGEVTFLQKMAYLFFGVNVQGAADDAISDTNIFPGNCRNGTRTTNGDTDFIVNEGVWNGAKGDHRDPHIPIVFLGVEDGLWSCYGWYMMDLTNTLWRKIVTDENGTVVENSTGCDWLYCQDRANYQPGSANIDGEIVDDDRDSFEFTLLHSGYRKTEFDGPISGGMWRRSGVDTSTVLRDVLLPCKDAASHGLNMGGADNHWIGSIPNLIPNFGASATYAAGKYVIYNNKLYKTETGHAAGAWNDADFTLITDKEIWQRNYYKVSLGHYRSYGANLGIASINANYGLAYSYGAYWRARLSPQLLTPTSDERGGV